MRDPLPEADYFILLSRAEDRPQTEVWPLTLDQPLPPVPVPLLAKDPDARLDLGKVFSAVYDEGRYGFLIAYSKPPDVPLSPRATSWAKKLLAGTRR
jgi:hypothetical protein